MKVRSLKLEQEADSLSKNIQVNFKFPDNEEQEEQLKIKLNEFCLLFTLTSDIKKLANSEEIDYFVGLWDSHKKNPFDFWLEYSSIPNSIIHEWLLAYSKAQTLTIDRDKAHPSTLTSSEIEDDPLKVQD